MTAHALDMSPRLRSRVAGAFYLITFLAGGFALVVGGKSAPAAGFIAAACYVAVTLLFYGIFKPVNHRLSPLAAIISLAGCGIGPLGMFVKLPLPANNISLVFFGFYCLLIGSLILKSIFLPRFLGALMVFAGLGWLTFLSPRLADQLYPYAFAPGILGEGSLTLWLLLVGVDAEKWTEQASGR